MSSSLANLLSGFRIRSFIPEFTSNIKGYGEIPYNIC